MKFGYYKVGFHFEKEGIEGNLSQLKTLRRHTEVRGHKCPLILINHTHAET